MGIGYLKEERSRIVGSCRIEEVLHGVERDEIIEIDLHRTLANTCNRHGPRIIRIPFPLITPVRHP